jgi:hypothetical protein
LQDKYPDITVASFDTSEEKLENLSADLGVKSLPHFMFLKAGKEVIPAVTGYKKGPLQSAMEQLDSMK